MLAPDQRQAPRYPIRSRGLLRIGDEIHGGTLHNGDIVEISLRGGLFVPDPAFNIRPGRTCHLTLLNGRSPPFVSLPGVVANCRPEQVAIAFGDFDESTTQTLQQLLAARMA